MSNLETDFSNLQAKDSWLEAAHLAYRSLALNSIFELILNYFFSGNKLQYVAVPVDKAVKVVIIKYYFIINDKKIILYYI